jgi:hypothetical protein
MGCGRAARNRRLLPLAVAIAACAAMQSSAGAQPSTSFSTFLGGSSLDEALGVAVDGEGNIYLTGRTASADFPNTTGAPLRGPGDAFVTRINRDGTLGYSTLVGGSFVSDPAFGIAVDASGNAYVVGTTAAQDFPTTEGAFQRNLAGEFDVFVVKVDPGGGIAFATYLGGTGSEHGRAIAVDGGGNAYVTGLTFSADFPLERAAQGARRGRMDAFVAKLNAGGDALAYSTYLGGDADENFDPSGEICCGGIAVDSEGNAYVTGNTWSDNFPVTALQTRFGGGTDAFAVKLGASGAIELATYIGGSQQENGNAIALDGLRRMYVVGLTTSMNFPVVNAFSSRVGMTGLSGDSDAFLTKTDPATPAVVYSTYFGGTELDRGHAVAVDDDGTATLGGVTGSGNLPLRHPVQDRPCGAIDAFVARLSASGAELLFGTFLGGGSRDTTFGVGVDAMGNVIAAGSTESENFPVVHALQPRFGGLVSDGFVTRIIGVGDLPTPTPTRTGEPAQCAGDCNDDGEVTVDELLSGVNIALGNRGLEACAVFDADGDGEVSVNELIRAVNRALAGCA